MDRPLLVTIATQRSGTKFLGSCLNAGGLVRSFGEPFKPGPPEGHFPRFLAGWLAAQRGFCFRGTELRAMLEAYLDLLQQEAAAEGRIAHLDVMYNMLGAFAGAWTWPVRPGGESLICQVLRARGAVVVHLVREDVAACVASTLIAEQRGYHRRNAVTEAEASLRVTADLAAAEREMRAMLAARGFVRRFFGPYPRLVEATYPDFIAGEGVAAGLAARLVPMLGLAEAAVPRLFGRSALRPTAPDKAQVVANWEALAALAARLRAEGARLGMTA